MIDPVLVKGAADIVIAYVKNKITTAKQNKVIPTPWDPAKYEPIIASSIDRHLREALAWSMRMQFYGMSRGEETEATTIALRLHSEPRRFRGLADSATYHHESELLADPRNYLLLGDPGAGKTTTVKRLVNHMLTAPPADNDHYELPIVVRVRELASPTLVDEIAVILGIQLQEFQPHNAEWWPSKQRWLGGVQFEHAISEVLNALRAVLIIDGLDEAPAELRDAVQDDLEHFARNAVGSKIIATCRTGDYTSVVEGLDLLEICPLSGEQIVTIARAWLPDPRAFQQQLASVPYHDLADRPLLLTQLLYIYQRYGYLPEQPSEIYRKVVALLLHEWDAERKIKRRSRYSALVPDRKAAFLSALAYHLTFRVRQKTFSADDLRKAYVAIHEQFGLPSDEATQVAEELETHTGIIVAAGPFSYEFSHLSLQEYLCAEYLVREPFAEYLPEYMIEYPAPVAVAVSLAAEPSVWFAALFLQRQVRQTAAVIQSFLARLLIERPFFSISAPLGVAILKLYEDVGGISPEARALLDRLAHVPKVHASVAAALQYYVSTAEVYGAADLIRLKLMKVLDKKRGFTTPSVVAIPISLLDDLVASGNERANSIRAFMLRNPSA